MRELSFRRHRNRYLLPMAILRPGSPTDFTIITANALLDTGATVSGVGPRVIAELELESYGKNRLRSATDDAFVSYYLFRLGLYTTEQLNDPQRVTALPFVIDEVDGSSWGQHADFDVILGMDILSLCEVHLNRSGTCRIVLG